MLINAPTFVALSALGSKSAQLTLSNCRNEVSTKPAQLMSIGAPLSRQNDTLMANAAMSIENLLAKKKYKQF